MKYLNLILQTLEKFVQSFIALTPNIIIAIIFAIITHFIAKLLSHIASSFLPKTAMRANLVIILQKLITIGIWFIGSLIISAIIFPSVTTANILATLGLTSVAIGLAFKNVFENFFTGVLLLFREPFSIGDLIIVDSQQGYVHHISVQNTHLRKTDGTRVYVPNIKVYNSTVQVLTDTQQRRKQISFSVDFSTDLEKARSTIKKAMEQSKTVAQDKAIQIYVASFSSNGIDFEIYWWTKPEPSYMRRSIDEVLTNIKKALDEEKIPMTYSTTVAFLGSLNLNSSVES